MVPNLNVPQAHTARLDKAYWKWYAPSDSAKLHPQSSQPVTELDGPSLFQLQFHPRFQNFHYKKKGKRH
jgi:hypothetical protein